MKIGKDWKIESDSMNVTLMKRTRVKAKDGKPAHDNWPVMGYYPTVKSALKGLVNFGVAETGLADIKSVDKKIDELHELISNCDL